MNRTPNLWIEQNCNYKVEPHQTLQYCRLLQLAFPHMNIMKGVVFYTLNDTLDGPPEKRKENFPGRHFWCEYNGTVYDVSRDWFDEVHSYQRGKIFQGGDPDAK